MSLQYLSVVILMLIAVAVIAIRLTLSNVRQDLKDGQEILKSELSEVRKLLGK